MISSFIKKLTTCIGCSIQFYSLLCLLWVPLRAITLVDVSVKQDSNSSRGPFQSNNNENNCSNYYTFLFLFCKLTIGSQMTLVSTKCYRSVTHDNTHILFMTTPLLSIKSMSKSLYFHSCMKKAYETYWVYFRIWHIQSSDTWNPKIG